MVNFINDFMKRNSKLSEEEAVVMISEFEQTIKKVIAVFGVQYAFKDLSSTALRFNKSIGEFIAISFKKYSLEVLESSKTVINDLLIKLLTENDEFKKSISQRTSDTDIVNYRLNLWLKELENAL
jgi:leucyl-tRNA synthetase